MTPAEQLQQLQNEDQFDQLALLKQESEQNAELKAIGLAVPETLQGDEKRLYRDFTMTLYHGLNNDVIDVDTIPELLEAYMSIDVEQRSDFGTRLFNMIEKKIVEKTYIQEAFEIRELDKEIDETAAQLPEEMRERFVHFINTGDGLTDEEWAQIKTQLNAEQEVVVLGRLERALNKDETLNIGAKPKRGAGMSPEEISKQFGLDDNSQPVQASAQAVTPVQNSGQSLYQAVQQKRDEVQAKPVTASIKAFDPLDTPIQPKKVAGLDDLLGGK
jgi:hypothetical protein